MYIYKNMRRGSLYGCRYKFDYHTLFGCEGFPDDEYVFEANTKEEFLEKSLNLICPRTNKPYPIGYLLEQAEKLFKEKIESNI